MLEITADGLCVMTYVGGERVEHPVGVALLEKLPEEIDGLEDLWEASQK